MAKELEALAVVHASHVRVAKARNATGHVCGERHHRARWPDAVVALARDIAEARGFGARRTTWELRRLGHEVGVETVKSWIGYHRRTLLKPTAEGDA